MKANPPPPGKTAFSLVELLVAMSVLVVITVVLVSIVGQIATAWVSTQSRVESFRNGRAVLEFMGRDLRSLVPPQTRQSSYGIEVLGKSFPPRASILRPAFQFIQDAGDPAQGLSPMLTNTWTQATNSSSWFGQARLQNTSRGDVSIVGYYLARSTSGDRYELRRLLVSPATTNGTNPDYKLFSSNAAYQDFASVIPIETNNYPDSPSWLYLGTPAFEKNSSALSDNVIAFWIRCLDRGGNPIPWLMNQNTQSRPFKFNSSAYFQTAPSSTNFFRYTSANTTPANELPAALECTIITVDSRVFLDPSRIPPIPAAASETDIPNVVRQYEQALINAGIKSARTFSSVIKLNGQQQ